MKKTNIHPNKFLLEYKNGCYLLGTEKPYNPNFPVINRNFDLWMNFMATEPELDNMSVPSFWVCLMDTEKKLKGIYHLGWETFQQGKITDILRIALMADSIHLVFIINQTYIETINESSWKVEETRFMQKELSEFGIEVIDNLLVDPRSFFSLKEHNFI